MKTIFVVYLVNDIDYCYDDKYFSTKEKAIDFIRKMRQEAPMLHFSWIEEEVR